MPGFAEGAVSKRGAVEIYGNIRFLGASQLSPKLRMGLFISSLDSRADPLALSTR